MSCRQDWMLEAGSGNAASKIFGRSAPTKITYPKARELNPDFQSTKDSDQNVSSVAISTTASSTLPTLTLLPHEERWLDNRHFKNKRRYDELGVSSASTSIHELYKQEKLDKLQTKDSHQPSLSALVHLERAKEECRFCITDHRSGNFMRPYKGLHVVSIATTCYLIKPTNKDRLHPLHFQIVPMEHSPSMHALCTDDLFVQEVRNYKKCLIRFWERLAKDTRREKESSFVFMECVPKGLHDKSNAQAHAVMDCVPVPRSAPDMRTYWYKCLSEVESEWTRQSREPITPLSRKNNSDTTASSVSYMDSNPLPLHFPYLYVEWAMDQGYVHSIEDAKSSNIDAKWMRRQLRLASAEYNMPRPATKHETDYYYKEFDWTHMLK